MAIAHVCKSGGLCVLVGLALGLAAPAAWAEPPALPPPVVVPCPTPSRPLAPSPLPPAPWPPVTVSPAPVPLPVPPVAAPPPAVPAAAKACPDHPACACRVAKDPTCPPKYDNRRFLENWAPCLGKPCGSWGDGSDTLKARRFERDGNIWANFGGQVRLRFESFNNIGFGAPADSDDAWMLLRTRAHADVHFGDPFRVYIEAIFADQYDDRELGPRAIDRNRGDLLNFFGEAKGSIGSTKVGFWLGRRELQTGKQRLVSPLDWANTRRTFQGLGLWAKSGPHAVDAWVARPVVIDFNDFDGWNSNSLFWGIDYTNTRLTCVTWGAYFLGLHNDTTATQVDQDRVTLGARVDGKIPDTRFDYDVEAAYQFGDQGAGNVSAGMFSGTFGWAPCADCWDPRLAVGIDWASGDDNPANADNGTFNQLFPLGHKYLGHTDLIGRRNVVAGRLEASVKPTSKLTVSAWYHLFWRADSADAAYNAGGGVLRAAGGVTDTFTGSELDIMLKYKLDRHWVVFLEWAHFFPGGFIDKTGANSDVDVWYLGAQGTF